MSSIKCTNCGLVNFVHSPKCKRCAKPMFTEAGEQHGSNLAGHSVSALNTAGSQLAVDQQQGDSAPPCVRCGTRERTTIREFKKSYYPVIWILIVWLLTLRFIGIAFGLLGLLVLWVAVRFAFRTVHKLTAPFCAVCWSAWQNAGSYGTMSAFGMLGLSFAVIGGSALTTWYLLLPGFTILIVAYVLFSSYVRKLMPKFDKVTSKLVIIDAPLVGKIEFVRERGK